MIFRAAVLQKLVLGFLMAGICIFSMMVFPRHGHGAFFGNEGVKELKETVNRYWNSRLTGDVITCYEIEEPSFKKMVPISQYLRHRGLIYKSVEVDKVEIKDDNAIVAVKVEYIIPALGSRAVFQDTIKDLWRKIDGKWYHVQKKDNTILGPKKYNKERR